MAVYGFSVTSRGSSLLSKLMASGSTLNITRVQFGTGKSTATNASGLASRTALISPLGDGEKSSPVIADGKMFINIQYKNSLNGGITTKTDLNEYGLFATDPDLGEILFLYGSLGDNPDVLLPYSSGIAITRKYQLSVTVGNVAGAATNFDSVGGYVVSTSAPTDKSVIWIDSAHNYLVKFWNGSAWKPASTSIPILSADPSSPEVGQTWVKT